VEFAMFASVARRPNWLVIGAPQSVFVFHLPRRNITAPPTAYDENAIAIAPKMPRGPKPTYTPNK
jgi:hypothetical protein